MSDSVSDLSSGRNLPDKVWPGGVPFGVELANLEPEQYGQMDGHGRKIQLSDSPTKTTAPGGDETTLFHEYLHAVLHVTGWSELLGEREEGLVVMLENYLGPLMEFGRMRNPPYANVEEEGDDDDE